MQCYTGCGLDKILYKFFRDKLKQDHGFFVDVGANDGITGSNSKLFELQGWDGLMVEANEDHRDILSHRRWKTEFTAVSSEDQVEFNIVKGLGNLHGLSRIDACDKFHEHVKEQGGEVIKKTMPAKTLTRILEENDVKSEFDILSIDVEGHELPVLQTLDLKKFRPRLLLIEDNSKGEDQRVRDYLKTQGYCRVCRIGVNEIYSTSCLKGYFLWKSLQCKFTYLRWSLKRSFYGMIGKKAYNPYI